MKRMSVLYLLAIVVCLFASKANAQGTVTWAAGYPKAGGTSGTIVIQGTATPDSGWVMDSGTVVYWAEGGGLQQTANFAIDQNGKWSFTISGLTPSATYNIDVRVSFSNRQKMTTATVSPDPKQSKAK